MDEIIYNIPLFRWNAYRSRLATLRTADVRALCGALRGADLQRICSVQILSTEGASEAAGGWLCGLPVDLVLADVEADYPELYQWAWLLEEGPARVTIPVVAGFGRAVKLALSLGFAVKLEPAEPAEGEIRELLQVLDLYLHRSGVCQPVDFFHGLLAAFYHDQPASLWTIQEEDPAAHRYITDEGIELPGRRFAGKQGGDARTILELYQAGLARAGEECQTCEFFERCQGYFKWPDREYRCAGIKSVLREIKRAGEELKRDAAAFAARQEAPGA